MLLTVLQSLSVGADDLHSILMHSSSTDIVYYKPTYEIVNDKPVVTFEITVATSRTYYSWFWMQGVKHADSSYSTYKVWLDDSPSYYLTITHNSADWGYSNMVSAYLSAGTHKVHIGSNSLDDVPNVEVLYIRTTQYLSGATANNYVNMKSHSQGAPSVGTGYATNLYFSDTEGDASYPPMAYTAERDKVLYYTIRRLEDYTAGQSVDVDVTMACDADENTFDTYIEIFPVDGNSTYSLHGTNTLTAEIDLSGFYYVLVRPADNNRWGTCDFNIDSSRYFENVPVNSCLTVLPASSEDSNYSCFALGKNCDTMSMIVTPANNFYGYKDDGGSPHAFSDVEWGLDSHIERRLLPGWGHFATLYNSLPYSSSASTADVYTISHTLVNYYANIAPFYPDYKSNDQMTSGKATNSYSGFSWALGEWIGNVALWWTDPSDDYEAEWLEEQANIRGYTAQGATAQNAVVDLYANDFGLAHAAVKNKGHYFAAGYAWESKLGARERVFHPRYALEGDAAGYVTYYLLKLPSYQYALPVDMRVIENAEFTEEEREFLLHGADGISSTVAAGFSKLWEVCSDESLFRDFLSLRQFERLDHYADLLAYCSKNPETLYTICLLAADDNLMAVKLLGDMTAKDNRELFKSVTSDSRRHRVNGEGKALARPVRTEAVLYIKGLINGGRLKSAPVTYSSDTMFTVEQSGLSLTVSLDLDHDAPVTIAYGSPQKSLLRFASDGERMKAGRQSICFDVPEPGIYVVSVKVNGSIYEKKVIVR